MKTLLTQPTAFLNPECVCRAGSRRNLAGRVISAAGTAALVTWEGGGERDEFRDSCITMAFLGEVTFMQSQREVC